MSKNTEWLSLCLTFAFSCLRLENKTLECCLTHLNSLTQKHMLQNTKATLYITTKTTRSAAAQLFPHDRSSKFSWWHAATGQWPPRPQRGLPYAAQRGHLGAADPGSVSGFITTGRHPGRRASFYSNSSVRDERLWIHSAKCFTSNTSILFHGLQVFIQPRKHAIVMSVKSLEFDLCGRVGEQKEFVLERIRLISLSHWFPQGACYQCLNSVLKAEVDFLMFKKARN